MGHQSYRKANDYVCAIAIGLALAVGAALSPCWWSVATGKHALPKCSPGQSDFIQFAAAAKMVVQGDAAALYDIDAQRAAQLAIDPQSPHVMPFYYAPFYAMALAPLGWMTFAQAFAVMTAINVGLLILSLAVLARRLSLDGPQTKWLAVTAACNMGVHYTLLQAQNSLLSLLLMALLVTDQKPSAGIWSGLLFFKPSLGIAPVLALLAKRRWQATAVVIITAGILGAISIVSIGPQGVAHYRELSLRAASSADPLQIEADAMFNLRGLVVYVLGSSFDAVWLIGSIAILSVALLRLSRGGSWGMFVIAMLLAAPHLHGHDLVLLVIPMAFFLKSLGELTPWTAAALVTFGMLPIVNNIVEAPPLLTIALLAFWARFPKRLEAP